MDANDHDDLGESGDAPPAVSRMARGGPRRYRTLSRPGARGRFARQKRCLPLVELIGALIEHHGLTDECRQRFVCIYWEEIVGERLAQRTWPLRFADGTLHVETDSSSWVHELQFQKATLIAKINAWVDANRVWLGPPPLVIDMRFELGGRRTRMPVVDREYVRRTKARQLRRLRSSRPNALPVVSDAERELIHRETSTIIDPELRRIIELVRVKWNR